MQNFTDGKIPVGDNKVSSLKKYAVQVLQNRYETEELNNIINWLLEHFAGLSKGKLNDPEVLVNQSVIIHFSNAVDRLLKGVPVQYVIGEVEFYRLKLKVDPSVLIPRLETEELVDLIIKENSEIKDLKILDIGTGSGCIALSLAKNLPGAKVTAVDISGSALNIAQKNADLNKIRNVEFIKLDIRKQNDLIQREFDIIVSNPPYISSSESVTMSAHVVDHEPSVALFVPDEDPLIFYSVIAEFGKKYLEPAGKIYVEINERLGKETASVFETNSFSSIHLLNDLFGKNRFIKVKKI